ncbi:hypothetical protein EGW08_014577, partial [Elysia chlorotica]
MSRQQMDADDDVTTNNNTGHIVVDNSENNNVEGGANQYNNEEDDENEEAVAEAADDELWLSDGDDEDENYMDDEDQELRMPSEQRVPVPISDLPETVTLLEKDGCLVYLVGTAHFSKESQDDVSKVIQATKPHVIMVELCQSRVNILKMDEAKILEEAKNINLATIQQVIKR